LNLISPPPRPRKKASGEPLAFALKIALRERESDLNSLALRRSALYSLSV
jgi:hypothetical protein